MKQYFLGVIIMKITRVLKYILVSILVLLVLDMVFQAFRPWYSNWGSNKTEISQALPGDDLVADPKIKTTRSITINATPGEVWPWIIQLGYERAGWYNYDFVNRIMGTANFVDGHYSSNRIVPDLQNLKVGDQIKNAKQAPYTVTALEPNRLLVLHANSDQKNRSLVYLLESDANGQTRLILRHRYYFTGFLSDGIYNFTEPGVFLMERKHLLGIKTRVEQY
jgi:hypothetical protein